MFLGGFRVLVERVSSFGRKVRESEEKSGMGLIIFFDFASNAAAFGTECCGIEVSDFQTDSGSGLNAAALSTQCCGIEGSVFNNFFSCKVNAATLGCECRSIGHTDFQHFFLP